MSDPERLYVEMQKSGPDAKVWSGGNVRKLPLYIRADVADARAGALLAEAAKLTARKGWLIEEEVAAILAIAPDATAALARAIAKARADALEEAAKAAEEATSLELMQHGENKIVERIRALAQPDEAQG